MRTALLALGILGLCVGGLALADGNESRVPEYEPAEGHRHARFSIYRVKEGTLMIDGSTGHTWRLEFRDKAGYTSPRSACRPARIGKATMQARELVRDRHRPARVAAQRILRPR
jgi:hypothetical protein